MNRKQELENFITTCCENSSIYYMDHQAVKYLCGLGKVVFFDQSRMIDYVEEYIPNYDSKRDEPILMDILHSGKMVNGCESHEYQGCHYCYTFLLDKTPTMKKTEIQTNILKLKYIGESFGVDSLTNGKIYTAIDENEVCYRVIDDSDEDYLYSKTNPAPIDGSSPGGRWEILSIEEGIFTLTDYEF